MFICGLNTLHHWNQSPGSALFSWLARIRTKLRMAFHFHLSRLYSLLPLCNNLPVHLSYLGGDGCKGEESRDRSGSPDSKMEAPLRTKRM